jgi:hypothetical protein
VISNQLAVFSSPIHQSINPSILLSVNSFHNLKIIIMKPTISFIIILLAWLLGTAAGTKAAPMGAADPTTVKVENRQTATATVTQEMGVVSLEAEKQSVGDFLSHNWGVLSLSLLSFLEVITRLTPTEKDNTVLTFLSNILNAIIPNFKKGGGRL